MKDINLLPEELKQENPIVETKKVQISSKAIILTLLIGAIAALILFAPKIYIKILESRVESTRSEVSGLKFMEVRRVESSFNAASSEFSSKKEVLNTVNTSSFPTSKIITSLMNAAPQGLIINSINISGSNVSVSCKAQNSLQSLEFLYNVNRQGLLKSNDLLGSMTIQKTNSRHTNTYTFTLAGKGGN